MNQVISTPRLKCTLLTKADRGSPEFEWLHTLHSDEKATAWSIRGKAKTYEDTEDLMQGYLPTEAGPEKIYRVAYAIHEILQKQSDQADQTSLQSHEAPTRFIGIVTVKSLGPSNLALPEDLTLPAVTATTVLQVELAYMFIPIGWGQGYATEAVTAVLESCKQTKSFWAPFSKLYVRAIVNGTNPASQRVMDKVGVAKRGVYHWSGKAIYLGGSWREKDDLMIYGKYLFE